MLIKRIFYIIFSISALLLTFYSVGKFMFFLSEPQKNELEKNINEKSSVVTSLFINQILLTCFVLQHTFMASQGIKNLFSKWGIDVISRSIYIFTSSILLLALVKYWRSIPITFWSFDTTYWLTWFIFVAFHTLAWSVIYTGCLFMDISELLGIKQVYYSLRKMPDPIEYKSYDLKRLYGHTRHPSFTVLLFILWFAPTMTLDRLVLATMLSIYMYLMWATDKYDLNYQQTQYFKKKEELYNVH